ncbi:BTAD domain-containing putative transcriptional regulator [Virgisporangium ochraceum]|uniref:BTAD domain-containing putative transcriptional regulator n=1 Tax=Virgisporangium ochraceum TaxID=65505 RepID=UPI0023B2FA8D|nr:BTAD domain-containing putative transcriptional regulator [Virgisporangium ochraceum]
MPLEERRIIAVEELFDAELAAGRHLAIVADLVDAVTTNPVRERLTGQLMTALYRGGRRAEALAAYRRTRQLLTDESGLEPGPDRLLAALTAVTDGEAVYAPSVLRRLVEAYTERPVARPSLDALTAREQEVLRLIGRGLSNHDIAGRLVVAEATVKTHVTRLMAKLGLTSRAQAVVMAYESGLVHPAR